MKGRKLLKALTNKYTPCAEQQCSRRENSDTMWYHMLSLKIIKIAKIMSKRKIEVGHFADNWIFSGSSSSSLAVRNTDKSHHLFDLFPTWGHSKAEKNTSLVLYLTAAGLSSLINNSCVFVTVYWQTFPLNRVLRLNRNSPKMSSCEILPELHLLAV